MDVLCFVSRTLANVTSKIICKYPDVATGSSRSHNYNKDITRKQTIVEHDERVINASNDEISTLN